MRFGSKILFDDVTTAFTPRRRYGLTGPNGAGKSTFMKLLTGELLPQSGEVARPAKLGVLSQDQYAFDHVRVSDAVIMSLGGWLQEQLFERRIVLVTGQLDDGAAAKAAAALLALDASGARPIDLHLASPDGALGAAFALIDTAETLTSALRVLCRGQVGGPAIGLVTAADHCTASPHERAIGIRQRAIGKELKTISKNTL